MVLSQRLLRVVPLALVASLACWAASRNNDDFCGTVGECIGLSFDDLVVIVLIVVATPLLLRALGVPRVVLHTLVALFVGVTLWYAADELLRALDPDRPYDALTPLPAALAAGFLAGAAAGYVSGPEHRRSLRLAVPVAVVVVALVAGAASSQASQEDRIAEFDAVPVTLYAPVVAGQGPTDAYASPDAIHLSYALDIAGDRSYLSVTLVPTSAEPPLGELVVVRDETTLVAGFDADDLDPAEVERALRDAPVAAPADLGSS